MHTQTVRRHILYIYIHIQYAVHHSPINYFTHVEIFKFFVLHPMKTSDYMRACSPQTLFNFNKLIACARGYEFEEDPHLSPIWLRAHTLGSTPKKLLTIQFYNWTFSIKSINFFKTVCGKGSSRPLVPIYIVPVEGKVPTYIAIIFRLLSPSSHVYNKNYSTEYL